MAGSYIKDSTLNTIVDAVNLKAGTKGRMKASEIARAILEIKEGNSPVSDNDIAFMASGAASPEDAAWQATAEYSIGELVFASNGNWYVSQMDGNIGNDPTEDDVTWVLFARLEGVSKLRVLWLSLLEHNDFINAVKKYGGTQIKEDEKGFYYEVEEA